LASIYGYGTTISGDGKIFFVDLCVFTERYLEFQTNKYIWIARIYGSETTISGDGKIFFC